MRGLRALDSQKQCAFARGPTEASGLKMPQFQPTALESALLSEFHTLYAKVGFPHPQQVRVLSRDNTGSGRYVELSSPGATLRCDGYLDLGGKFIQMEGVPNGMMAVVLIVHGQPKTLELTVYGEDGWDGTEHQWVLR